MKNKSCCLKITSSVLIGVFFSQNILSYSTPFYLNPSSVSENLLEKTTLENQLSHSIDILNNHTKSNIAFFKNVVKERDFTKAFEYSYYLKDEDEFNENYYGNSLVSTGILTDMFIRAVTEWKDSDYIYVLSDVLGEIAPTLFFPAEIIHPVVTDKKDDTLKKIIEILDNLTSEIKNKTEIHRKKLSRQLKKKTINWGEIQTIASDLENTLNSLAEQKSLKAVDALTNAFIKACEDKKYFAARKILSAIEKIGPRAHHKMNVLLETFEDVVEKDQDTAHHIITVLPELIPNVFGHIENIKEAITDENSVKIEELTSKLCKVNYAVSKKASDLFDKFKEEANQKKLNWYDLKNISKEFEKITYNDIPSFSLLIETITETVDSNKENKWPIIMGLSSALGYAESNVKPALPALCYALSKAYTEHEWNAVSSIAVDIEVNVVKDEDIQYIQVPILTDGIIEARKAKKSTAVLAIVSIFKKIGLKAPEAMPVLIDTLFEAVREDQRNVAKNIMSILSDFIPDIYNHIEDLKQFIIEKNKKKLKMISSCLDDERYAVNKKVSYLLYELKEEVKRKRLRWSKLRNLSKKFEKITYNDIPSLSVLIKNLKQIVNSKEKRKWTFAIALSSVFGYAGSKAKPAIPILYDIILKAKEENVWNAVYSIADDIEKMCKNDDTLPKDFPVDILLEAALAGEWDAVRTIAMLVSKNTLKVQSIPVLIKTYEIALINHQEETAEKIAELLEEIGPEGQIAIYSLTLDDISKWVKLRAFFTKEKKEISTNFSEYPRSLVSRILEHKFSSGELRIRIEPYFAKGIFKNRSKFIALALFIALTDTDNLENIVPVKKLIITRCGLVQKIEELHLHYDKIENYLEYVLLFTYQSTKEDLTKWLSTIKYLNIGQQISSGIRGLGSNLDIMPNIRIDVRHIAINNWIERFEKAFVRTLRKYDMLKNPEFVHPIPKESSFHHQQRIENMKKHAFENILHPDIEWIVDVTDQERTFNNQVPYLQGIRGLILQVNKGEEDMLTVGNQFVFEVRRLLLNVSSQIQEIASGKADLTKFPIELKEHQDVFIDTEQYPDYTTRYINKMLVLHRSNPLQFPTLKRGKLLSYAH